MTPDELARLLRELRTIRDEELRKEFDRSLPFSDGLFDRWERAKRLGFGKGASIYDSSLVFGDVSVGSDTWIGPGTIIDGSGGGISIGATCSISSGVHLYTHDTVLWALSGGELGRREGAIRIGDCVHIGAQSVVAPGVTIGSRCVIAANSFVNSDIPDGSVFGGTPAKLLGQVIGEGKNVRMTFNKVNR